MYVNDWLIHENGNNEAIFDVSKLTVFCVNVFSNEKETTQTTTQNLSEVQLEILKYLQNHPEASRKEIAANIDNITEDGVKYNLQKLQQKGLLKRVGPNFGGYWDVICENS